MIYKYQKITDYNNKEYKSFYNNLTNDDKIIIDKILKIKDKHAKILARIILKDLLSKYHHIDYNNIFITYNQFGKPSIDNINFNISHSHDYVCTCISDNIIGIDIEKIRPINLKIAKQFCTENEYKYIINSTNKYYSFWKIFTLKEAYFKMIGTNLSNMKSIEFTIDENNTILNKDQSLKIISSNEIKDYIISIIYK